MVYIICNFPKFSDRQVWANSVDPDQTAPLSGSTLFAIPSADLWMQYSKEKPSCSTFRVIPANFRVSEIFGFYTTLQDLGSG